MERLISDHDMTRYAICFFYPVERKSAKMERASQRTSARANKAEMKEMAKLGMDMGRESNPSSDNSRSSRLEKLQARVDGLKAPAPVDPAMTKLKGPKEGGKPLLDSGKSSGQVGGKLVKPKGAGGVKGGGATKRTTYYS